ncbi:MAG: restriction endonuclease [bacterium]|nr:MAG: restriction endonuclease [bacterium]
MKQTVTQKKAKYHHTKANVSIYNHLEEDGFYYQLVEGVLHMAPSPFTLHQRISSRLNDLITGFLKIHPLGELFYAPLDVELNDLNIFQPDLFFVSNNHLEIITEKRVVGAPDLIIEILSKSTKKLDLTTKYTVYEQSGVLEYWIVDPDEKRFSFYQSKDHKYYEVAVQDSYASQILKPLHFKPFEFWKQV